VLAGEKKPTTSDLVHPTLGTGTKDLGEKRVYGGTGIAIETIPMGAKWGRKWFPKGGRYEDIHESRSRST